MPGLDAPAGELRGDIQLRRGQRDLLQARRTGVGEAVDRADAARVRVRREGQPLHDPQVAPAGDRTAGRALLRAAAPRSPTRAGWVPRCGSSRQLPPRRRAAGGRARGAAAGAARVRVPPRELVLHRRDGEAARGRRGAGDRRPPRAPVPDPRADRGLHLRPLPPRSPRAEGQLLGPSWTSGRIRWSDGRGRVPPTTSRSTRATGQQRGESRARSATSVQPAWSWRSPRPRRSRRAWSAKPQAS